LTTLSVPYIETEDGDIITENSAIANFISRLNPGAQLSGGNLFEEA
jgi:glutathione S-transferase